jgi:hypothetical protein
MAQTCLPPGFRFHPTDVELVSYYLKRKIMGKKLFVEAISVVELYKFAPWDLPGNSLLMLLCLSPDIRMTLQVGSQSVFPQM